MKFTLHAPNNYGPREDLAFTLYAINEQHSMDKVKAAVEHLEERPSDINKIGEIFDLNERELEQTLERFRGY